MDHAKIKSKLSKKNALIMRFDPHQDIRCHPKVHYGVNPYLLEINHELYHIGRMHLKSRREKMWNLLRSDFLQEDVELRQVDLAYINTQP